MLQVARLAPKELDEATEKVADYIREQFNPGGGVNDRDGNSDLYYTVFGLAALTALRAEASLDPTRAYIAAFGVGDELDLVHLSCLARCMASLQDGDLDRATRDGLLRNLERFRGDDGGYGTVYHSFLACGAHQDLGIDIGATEQLVKSVQGLRTTDGAYANEAGMAVGSTPATAAALTLLRNMGVVPPHEAAAWLLQRVAPDGGFLAVPQAPLPDLLSTATALHALAGMQVSFEEVKSVCLDFVDTLWTGRAFCGNWSDDCPDVEYTFYGLLALGHLSL